MKNIILSFIFTLIATIVFGQQKNKNVLYVVDSIPVLKEPKEILENITANEIEQIVVVKNNESIKKAGYKDLDGIVYLFTKSYSHRTDSIKAIPTTKLMIKKKGSWYLKGRETPYTGPFIDYYLNGQKQSEGFLFNGRLKGKKLIYHPDGTVSD